MSATKARRFGGRLALVAVLSGLLLSSGLPVPGRSQDRAQAAAKTGSSWKLSRVENFSGSSLPTGCTPYAGVYKGGANAWTSKQAKVSGGVLGLKLRKQKTSGKPYAAGGIACLKWGQKYGKYVVQARIPKGAGIDSTIGLVSNSGWTGMELLAPAQEAVYSTNGYGRNSDRTRVPGTFSGKFHDYAIEWSPKQVRMTVDGKQIYYSTHADKSSHWFWITVSTGDKLTGLPDTGTSLPAQLQITSVKVYSYTGVAPPARDPAVTFPTPTPSPTPVTATTAPAAGAKTPNSGATGLATQPTSAHSTRPTLAGGIWPWLLGGSLVAAFAIAILNYPLQRRQRKAGLQK